MKKYTANYAYTNPNFVIQNVADHTKNDLIPTIYVLKNILQRGFPTRLSLYLQSKLGKIHQLPNFQERFLFSDPDIPLWYESDNCSLEAQYLLEEIFPTELGEYAFVTSMFLPKVPVSDIVEEIHTISPALAHRTVELYCPTLKLIIDTNPLDAKTDHLQSLKGIKTIYFSKNELRNKTYQPKIKDILAYLEQKKVLLSHYKKSYDKLIDDKVSELDIQTKLLPTAIIRFQLLILELLASEQLSLSKEWDFRLLSYEDVGDYASWAIEDLEIWFSTLWELRTKEKISFPPYQIHYIHDVDEFHLDDDALDQEETQKINVDFSLLKRYTDENEELPHIIFVRNDYFDIVKDKNYFRVSTTDPIDYHIVDSDKENLQFLLQNIFDKPHFREGQFPIIANALNQKDTIGLLPTGGGKSICYQLPCLLQPAVNFVVCPIKSLMYDQYDNLVKTLITNVDFITSDLTTKERQKVEKNFELGRYLFVWISPEKLQIPHFRQKLKHLTTELSIAYAVIDEVHCLSEWGHDFRTSYLNLARTVDALSPKDELGEGIIKFIGLTATASVNVLKDIKIEFSRQKSALADENIKALLDYSRKELNFIVIDDEGNKTSALDELLEYLVEDDDFIENPEKAGLIFTPYVNGPYGCYSVFEHLNKHYPNKVAWFAGSLPLSLQKDFPSEKDFSAFKQQTQKDFKENKYPLLVATKAFGMGIDKQNIFYTIHYGLPSSIEALYQEAGRAGRWDKNAPENRHKQGNCFVLHSPETMDDDEFSELFERSTSFEEINTISKKFKGQQQDIMRQVFLLVQGQNDVKQDLLFIREIIDGYYQENTAVTLYWREFGDRVRLEKQIYRLSLLGIVSDWTSNFKDSFCVYFASTRNEHVLKHLERYIEKYDPLLVVKEEILKSLGNSFLEKSIYFLLNWIFENIVYHRKQSLKTLSDWCTDFIDSDHFKRRLDSYFTFTDTTFILQHIAENPHDYPKWLKVFPLNAPPKIDELTPLKDSLSRFLESYRNNTGLNFISGLIRLSLGEFNDADGQTRLLGALENIKQNFQEETIHQLISQLIQFGTLLEEDEQKIDLAFVIFEVYPEQLERLSMLCDIKLIQASLYQKRIRIMKKLKRKLYEQLKRLF